MYSTSSQIQSVDGTTIQLVGGQISLKAGGVGTTQLAGGIPLSKLAAGVYVNNTGGGNPGSTNSLAAYIMMGLGSSFAYTPTKSGNVVIVIQFNSLSDTLGDGCRSQMRYGTGTAPINGAAVAGTAISPIMELYDFAANKGSPTTHAAILSGLVLNTAYWFDIGLEAITGGNAYIQNTGFSVMEATP